MKNLIKYALIAVLVVLATSCEEEVRKHNMGTAPMPVSDITSESGNGFVVLKWKTPEDPNYFFTQIEYVDTKGKACSRNISKYSINPESGYSTDTIEGFGDTKEYTFNIYACSEGGAKSAPEIVKQTPLSPLFDLIIETITCESDFGGMQITWNNELGKEAYVVVRFVVNGKVIKTVLDASKKGIGTGAVSGAVKEEPTDFRIVVTDKYENESRERIENLIPVPEIKFEKSKWTIPGYVASSANKTIGYSSQATNEGDEPKGRVTALLDDDLETFWHSSWSNPNAAFPHWFIIDLGEEVTISRVSLTRRQSDNGESAQKGHMFYTALENTDDKDSDNWEWTDHEVLCDFDVTEKAAQVYRLSKNPRARYLKVYFPEAAKGKNNHAMLSDIQIYGSR